MGATNLAMWLDPKFGATVSSWVYHHIRGHVQIASNGELPHELNALTAKHYEYETTRAVAEARQAESDARKVEAQTQVRLAEIQLEMQRLRFADVHK